ncbi:hypothetical protein Tco_0008568 [Tanacetum coccineum]
MLVQPTEDEGEGSERPSEPQPIPSPPHPSTDQHETQTNPSPRPLPTSHIPDSIPEGSGGNHGGQSSSDKSLSGNEGDMTLQSVYDLCISLCTQVTDQAKEIKHLKAQIKKLKKKAKLIITQHKAWNEEFCIQTGEEFAKAEDRDTALTRKKLVLVDRPDEGYVDQLKERSATPTLSPTPTPTIFGDDETIAQPLALSRSRVATPKDKAQHYILRPYSLDKSDTESEDINESEKKFKMLAHDEEIARKVQEDWEAEEEVKKLAEKRRYKC